MKLKSALVAASAVAFAAATLTACQPVVPPASTTTHTTVTAHPRYPKAPARKPYRAPRSAKKP